MFTVTRGLVSVCISLQKRGSTSVTCVLTQPSAGLTSISTWPSTLSSWSTQTLTRSWALLQPTQLSARTAPTTTGSNNRPQQNIPLLFSMPQANSRNYNLTILRFFLIFIDPYMLHYAQLNPDTLHVKLQPGVISFPWLSSIKKKTQKTN